jgi:acetoin utilization deacetylase AcuC-like enzyme
VAEVTGLGVVWSPEFGLHVPDAYPEGAARLAWAMEGLAEAVGPCAPCSAVDPLDDSLLQTVHSRRYLDELEELCRIGGGALSIDTEVNQDSARVARLAAACCCRAADLACASGRPVVALVRPPGHHAGRETGTGFCLLNNVAIAARHLVVCGAKRVAIVDWDAHHGNGTYEIYARDPSVFYVSLHEYPLYPLTGWITDCGLGAAEGTKVSLPLPGGLLDGQALEVFSRVALPALRAFRPEAILVSAGEDGHWSDPMSSWRLTARSYAEMAAGLLRLAAELGAAPPVLVLEGGYSHGGLRSSWAGIGAALTGQSPPPSALSDLVADAGVDPGQKQAFDTRLEQLLAFYRRFWPLD